MNKQEFLSMKTNKKTVELLRKECEQRLAINDQTAHFFAEVSAQLIQYIYLPRKVKSIATETTTNSIYEALMRIKGYGYRKELVMPF